MGQVHVYNMAWSISKYGGVQRLVQQDRVLDCTSADEGTCCDRYRVFTLSIFTLETCSYVLVATEKTVYVQLWNLSSQHFMYNNYNSVHMCIFIKCIYIL